MDILSIPAVLGTILQYLDSKYVALYRLVSTTWNHEACKILQNRVIISFPTLSHLTNYNQIFQSPIPEISLRFQHFSFPSSLFTSAIEDIAFGDLKRLQNSLQSFYRITGSNVTQLKLVVRPLLLISSVSGSQGSSKQCYSTVMFTEMLEMIYTHFPNLQHLKLLFILSAGSSIRIPDDNELVIKINNLLDSHADTRLPNLKSVQLDLEILQEYSTKLIEEVDEDSSLDKPLEQRLISTFIKNLLKSAVKLEVISTCCINPPHVLLQECIVKSLTLASKRLQEIKVLLPILLPENLNNLDKLDFPNLTTIQLVISGDHELAEDNLKRFLFRHRSSLQKINWIFRKSWPQFLDRIPFGILMINLRTLVMEQFEGSVDFRMLPVLKHLILKQCSLSSVVSSSPSPKLLDTLEIIEGTLDTKGIFLSAFEDVAPYWLPNLSTLTVTKISFPLPLQIIFRECRKLRRLTIKKIPGITDSVLCGIRQSLIRLVCPVERVQQTDKDREEDPDTLFGDMVKFAKGCGQASIREYPFIGDLEDLQFLTLEGEFSDVAILYGVIHCDMLTRLSLKSDLCTWRSLLILRQAFLGHLVASEIKGDNIN